MPDGMGGMGSADARLDQLWPISERPSACKCTGLRQYHVAARLKPLHHLHEGKFPMAWHVALQHLFQQL